MKAELLCVICGLSVKRREVTATYEVIGWVTKRAQGGANQIKHKKSTGRWAHTYCLMEKKVARDQMTIDDYL